VSKHADVQAVSRDPVTYSSDQDRGGITPLEEPETPMPAGGIKVLIAMDPPEHTRYRKLVNRGFTPRMINALEPRIRELAASILDRAIAKRTCDFVVDVAAELPVEVISELIGVPKQDRHKIFEWTNRIVGAEDPEYFVSEDQMQRAMTEMFVYVHELCEQRRREPRDDIMSALLQAELEGDKLSIWYVSANRDEDVFDDPFRFDIEREPNDHVAFGGPGPHFCLGASLARLELRVLFEELARRVPVLRPLGAPARLRSNIVAGIKHLPVELSATPVP
jgi:cytochrome P450